MRPVWFRVEIPWTRKEEVLEASWSTRAACNPALPSGLRATFCQRFRGVSSCKMKGVDIFEIPTNSGFQLYFQPRFRGPQAFSLERD